MAVRDKTPSPHRFLVRQGAKGLDGLRSATEAAGSGWD